MGLRGPKFIWNLESGVCPYGHPVDECVKMRKNYHGSPQPVCSINERKVKRERAQRLRDRRKAERAIGMPPPFYIEPCKLQPIKVEDKPLIQRVGTLEHTGMYVAGVQCVHGHWNMYSRHYEHYTIDPSPMFCRKCDDYVRVHQVASIDSEERGMVYWPLESKPEIYPHMGSKGSGRS